LHDELQLRVLRGRAVTVRWRDAEGVERERFGPVADVFSRSGAEFLQLDDGEQIRLDHLVAVDGVVFEPGAHC
jgi:hypothetical protein